jgi:hypothetical protein
MYEMDKHEKEKNIVVKTFKGKGPKNIWPLLVP